VEDAVVAVGAYGEGLGVVLEGVGWWFGALVDDGEFAALLEEIEGGVGADAMDASGSYVAGDTEVANVCLVAHALEFADGDVVALVVASAAEGQVGDGPQDDHRGDDEFDRALAGFVWHGSLLLVYVQSNLRGTPTPPFFAQSLVNIMVRLVLRDNFFCESPIWS